MRQRPNIHLTREDREAVSRWWCFMLPAVLIVVLTLLGAQRAYQTLWGKAPSMQMADEISQESRQIGFSQPGRAK
jgi:hypothetical protein